jgi:hypothetical protein
MEHGAWSPTGWQKQMRSPCRHVPVRACVAVGGLRERGPGAHYITGRRAATPAACEQVWQAR